MDKKIYLAFILAVGAVLPAQAQTVYPAPAPDHYLAMPVAQPQGGTVVSSAGTSSSSTVVYSPQEYPTAQGKFLTLPPGAQQQGTYQQQVVATAPAQPPAPAVLTVPKDVYPVSPAPLSSGAMVASVPAPPPIVTPAPTPQIYSAPKPVPASYIATSNTPAAPQVQPVTPTSYEDMPTYTYSPSTDPARPGYKTPIARDPKANDSGIGLATLSGFELGLGASEYRYQEFDPSGQRVIRITGPTFSVLMDATKAYKSGWFYSGDFRLSYGVHDYTGGDQNINTGVVTPSTQNDIPDLMLDFRLLGGHDFLIQDAFWGAFDVDLAPYSGFAFRFLYDDSSGTDSNGVQGYERYSHYLYLPLGLTSRFPLTDTSRLSANLEYDLLLHGWQTSALGDENPGDSDLTNDQNTGYGLRGSLMYERRSWSAGPYFEFWDIGQSSTDCNGTGSCGFEPHNQTIEFGIEGKYRF